MERRGGFPVRLSSVLPGALERMGPKGVWTEARLRRAWQAAVGDDLAARTEVRRLNGSVLEVDAENETWATQLRYLGHVVVGRLNDILGPGTVSEIVVRRRGHRSERGQGSGKGHSSHEGQGSEPGRRSRSRRRHGRA